MKSLTKLSFAFAIIFSTTSNIFCVEFIENPDHKKIMDLAVEIIANNEGVYFSSLNVNLQNQQILMSLPKNIINKLDQIIFLLKESPGRFQWKEYITNDIPMNTATTVLDNMHKLKALLLLRLRQKYSGQNEMADLKQRLVYSLGMNNVL